MNGIKQYFYNIGWTIYSLSRGLKQTFLKMFQGNITVQYPFETKDFTVNQFENGGFRGKLVNYTADCISCNKCVVACPVDCISLTASKRDDFDPEKHQTSTGHPLRLKLESYDINMDKCMYCNLCTEACPTDCLVMTSDIEYSSDNRDDMTIAFCDKSDTGHGRL